MACVILQLRRGCAGSKGGAYLWNEAMSSRDSFHTLKPYLCSYFSHQLPPTTPHSRCVGSVPQLPVLATTRFSAMACLLHPSSCHTGVGCVVPTTCSPSVIRWSSPNLMTRVAQLLQFGCDSSRLASSPSRPGSHHTGVAMSSLLHPGPATLGWETSSPLHPSSRIT